jgi:Rod binding domain-containing protein
MSVLAIKGGSDEHSIPKDSPLKIHQAAQQFESFMIGQMLRSMRDSGESWMGTGDEGHSAGDTAMGMAEEEFAKALSARGGLGLARMVEAGLQPHAQAAESVDQKQTE